MQDRDRLPGRYHSVEPSVTILLDLDGEMHSLARQITLQVDSSVVVDLSRLKAVDVERGRLVSAVSHISVVCL